MTLDIYITGQKTSYQQAVTLNSGIILVPFDMVQDNLPKCTGCWGRSRAVLQGRIFTGQVTRGV